MRIKIIFSFLITIQLTLSAQIRINEGSNKNYSTIADEDGEFVDWIELYNAGNNEIDLFNYSLSDNSAEPTKYIFPHYTLGAGAFLTVYCSNKNRYQTAPMTPVLNQTAFIPQNGWNEHVFTEAFAWDGVSNLCLNVCSYQNTGYTVNSEFRQSDMGFPASISNFNDGNDASCGFATGTISNLRPVIKINGVEIGDGNLQNSPYDYPAPYGNWYWSARNQFVFLADELIAAGIQPGPINSIAFDVISANPVEYTYVDFQMNNVPFSSYDGIFLSPDGYQFHTNFGIGSSGETIYLFNPQGSLVHQLNVDVPAADLSIGCLPNGSNAIGLFQTPTPGESNNSQQQFSEFALPPVFTINSGIFTSTLNVGIFNANNTPSTVHYTTDGSDPNLNSPIYTGTPLFIFQNTVLKARCFKSGFLPSEIKSATYLIGISHTTPIVSVTTSSDNLYGPNGIFDNFNSDWEKAAHIQYFDETPGHPLLFSQATSMRMDGGAGGSRSHPQHSFRLDFDHSILGEGSVNFPLIPNRPNRNTYSSIYLRNGSNQWMVMPYKDAAQVRMMGKTPTHNLYMEWRPVSVYINGNYFGLYELREKFDKEYFEIYEGAGDELDLLSLSYFYGGVLRAVEGNIEGFYTAREQWDALPVNGLDYINAASQLFDLENYTDYIISQLFMANTDWPQNNIKMFRKDSLSPWKFCIQDLELGLNPNGWTDCEFNALERLTADSEGNPYSNIWLKSLQNEQYQNYFLNRTADLLNSTYLPDSLQAVANDRFDRSIAEMPKEFARWGDPNNVTGQMNELFQRHQLFLEELACRPDALREDYLAQYSIAGTREVNLDIAPAQSGKIKISTIIPVSYPWSGAYFKGIPIQLEAIADSGFIFSHWDANPNISNVQNPVFSTNLMTNNFNFKANFIPDPTAGFGALKSTGICVYPNPANLQFTINTGNITHDVEFLELMSMDGRIVLSQGVEKSNSIVQVNCASIPSGVYLLRVFGKNGISMRNVAVRH